MRRKRDREQLQDAQARSLYERLADAGDTDAMDALRDMGGAAGEPSG